MKSGLERMYGTSEEHPLGEDVIYYLTVYNEPVAQPAEPEGVDVEGSTSSTDPLDRYLLAKCRDYVADMTESLDSYAVADACELTRGFLDVLTNWYIRRSRDRFWSEDEQAFATLYTVLETLTRVAVDVSGRPFLVFRTEFKAQKIGSFDTELVREFFQAFAMNAGITLHVETLYGDNAHHIAESCFKGLARALRQALEVDPREGGRVPSTKGAL